jgi:phage-related tail protein
MSSSSSSTVPSPALLDTMVRVIMGQTEMTHEEVLSALERTNYNLKQVIREYIQGSKSDDGSTHKTVSANQMRFSEIRNFMDKSDALYYRRQEMTKIYNQVQERKKALAEATEATEATEVVSTAKL